MFKILGFKKEKKKKKKPPLQICEFQWKMSICGNWKVLWCFQCISWIGERKKRLKASFWNGWKAPFQHFGRETFLVFILKWLSIYFFHYIMCYKYDTKSSQIEAWHLCLLKVNCFELPERTLRCCFFFYYYYFLCRELWHLQDLLCWSTWPHFNIHREMALLSSSEPVRAQRFCNMAPNVTLCCLLWGTLLLKRKLHITETRGLRKKVKGTVWRCSVGCVYVH